jgi:uncharacterized protein YjbI with pentapeptide repeats
LNGAKLHDAFLNGADLTNAELAGAELDDADLTGAIGIRQAQLDEASCGTGARLDPGLTLKPCWDEKFKPNPRPTAP